MRTSLAMKNVVTTRHADMEERSNNMPCEKNCGSCTYNRPCGSDYICDNEDSVNYGAYTDYDDGCDDYEQKGGDV